MFLIMLQWYDWLNDAFEARELEENNALRVAPQSCLPTPGIYPQRNALCAQRFPAFPYAGPLTTDLEISR